jgi:hypothetical protein
MEMSKPFLMFVGFFLIFSIAIFFAGVNETIRIESFSIVDNNLWGNYSYVCENPLQTTSACTLFTNTTTNAYNDYEEFKTSYVFTNEPAILFLNFFGLVGLLGLLGFSFYMGWNSAPFTLTDIFTKFNVLLILSVYLINLIFQYIQNIFVDQLIIVLFLEIYSAIYMYQIVTTWFMAFVLVSYVLYWLANELRYINLNQ